MIFVDYIRFVVAELSAIQPVLPKSDVFYFKIQSVALLSVIICLFVILHFSTKCLFCQIMIKPPGAFYTTPHPNTGCPNSVTNLISSLLWISIVIPNFKSHNIIMSARAYFMKRVKDVSIMSPQDEQWRQTSFLCLYTAIFLFY